MQRNSVLVAAAWLCIVIMAFSWNVLEQRKSHTELAFSTSHAFFRQVELTRNWNASHGGVYVLVTDKTRPNPYLEVDNRDLTSNNGVAFTKVNPAYMTRQIAEIASQEEGIQFHITSLNPIRPANKPSSWEETFLKRFQEGSLEEGEFVSEDGKVLFRYMAPLLVKEGCLPCHSKQGYKLGDIRGGISVTMPQFKPPKIINLAFGYGIVGILGAFLIFWGGNQIQIKQENLEVVNGELIREVTSNKELIAELTEKNEQVETLSGIVPICMHCKEIRDDKGYWNKLEIFIEDKSSAKFSHSICDKCLDHYYPEEDDDDETEIT